MPLQPVSLDFRKLHSMCRQTTCDICAIIWGKGQEKIERKCISLISVWDCGRVRTFQSSNISISAGERNLGTGQFLEPFRVPNDVMVSALLFQIVVSRPWKTAGQLPRGTSWLLGSLHVVFSNSQVHLWGGRVPTKPTKETHQNYASILEEIE